MLEQTRRNADEFVWDAIRSVEELGQLGMAAMNDFLGDFASGKADGFLYRTQLGAAFHQSAIREMRHVAADVRIFPLIQLGGRLSPFVVETAADLGGAGYEVSLDHVPYEFRRGSNQMMRIRAASSS